MVSSGGVKYQYLAGFCVNIASLAYGAFCGWPSAAFVELNAPDSSLKSGPLSAEDAGWVGSLVCIGGLVGTILYAWIADKIGRKPALLLLAVPSLAGWLIIPIAQNPFHLCIARFLGGIAGGGCFAVIPIYIAELAVDSIRGVLGTFLVLSCNVGMLIVFICGYFFNYAMTALIMSAFNLVFIGTFIFMPETPIFLTNQNKLEEAEAALRYYRNISSRPSKQLSEELQMELQKLRTTEKEDELEKQDSSVTWQDFNNRTARKALIIGLALMVLNQFSGCYVMLIYSGSIFQAAGSNMSPNVASILIGVIQLVGAYASTALVERAGRKILLVISAVGTGLGQACFCIYNYLTAMGYDTSSYRWIPVASFSFIIFIACWGVLTLPFLVISEITPPKIRNLVNMICMSVMWILGFVVFKLLPLMTPVLGMEGVTFVFSVICFSGAVFIAVFVPETKGKSIETILASL